MNSTQALQLLDQIAATASVKAKEQLLRDNISDDFFATVCKMAYDPFITFGIASKTMTEIEASIIGAGTPPEGVWAAATLNVLKSLRTRELSGDAARAAIRHELILLDDPGRQLLRRVLLKDLRAGFGETLLAKVSPGMIPEFPYMRCTLTDKIDLDEWFAEDGAVISQEKADGMFTNVNKDATGYVWLTTRQGTPIPREPLEAVYAAVEACIFPATQTHGELVVVGPDGKVLPREKGNGQLNSVLKGGALDEGHRVMLLVWDQIPLAKAVPKGKCEIAYKRRLQGLIEQMPLADQEYFPLALIPTRVVKSKRELYAHFAEMLAAGKEGTIASRITGIWKDSDSAKEKAKLKLEVTVDLRVMDFLPGEGKNAATFGSLLCATDCEQLHVGVSGFTDKQRVDLWTRRDQVKGSIIAVKANEIMYPSKDGEKHSLFLPRVEEFRADKGLADTLVDVIRQFNVAKGLEGAVPA